MLSTQLGDDQLAIAVARAHEGDDGPVLREFLTDRILPQATADGNRWMATWALWMLGKRDSAVRALVVRPSPLTMYTEADDAKLPLSEVLSPPETPRLDAKLFLADDPALVVLYKQLRERSVQTLRGAVSISPRAEWDFVMHIARVYARMGCDFLALDLGSCPSSLPPCAPPSFFERRLTANPVRTWNFILPPARPRAPTAERAAAARRGGGPARRAQGRVAVAAARAGRGPAVHHAAAVVARRRRPAARRQGRRAAPPRGLERHQRGRGGAERRASPWRRGGGGEGAGVARRGDEEADSVQGAGPQQSAGFVWVLRYMAWAFERCIRACL